MDNGGRRETQIDSRDALLRKIFQKMNNQDKISLLSAIPYIGESNFCHSRSWTPLLGGSGQ